MVLDDRMPEDTLFLIFEEDFRFWPTGEDPDRADDYRARLEEVEEKREKSRSRSPSKGEKKDEGTEAQAASTGAASSSAPGAYRLGGKGKKKGKTSSRSIYLHRRGGPPTSRTRMMG